MHVTCKCLNVSIRSRSAELQRVNIANIELTDLERADAFFREFFNQKPQKFFTDGIMALPEKWRNIVDNNGRAMIPSVKNFCGFWLKNCDQKRHELFPGPNISISTQDLANISELETITKEQPGLMEIRNVGSWIIHRCYNCSMYTHAVHREYGAALVLINNNILLSPEEINKLKSNPDYSPVFRIVINHSLEDLDDYLQQPNKFSVSQLPNTVQVALDGLQRQLEEAVQHQTTVIEDKIRAFTAEQYQMLEQFRERAHNEHRLLSKLMCRGEETNRVTNNIETPPTTPDGFKSTLITSAANTMNPKSNILFNDTKVSSGSNVKHDTIKHYSKSTINNESLRKKDPLYICTKESASFDTEALFPFEGIEDTDAASQQLLWSSEEGSDTDSSQNEGIHMPRGQRDGHSTLAKSLPVTVPVFPSIVRRAVQDQDDDQLPTDPLDPHNIRASIKALAKSVHGDTVFGDLPRPRFSTQI